MHAKSAKEDRNGMHDVPEKQLHVWYIQIGQQISKKNIYLKQF